MASERKVLKVSGMSCAACSARIEKSLSSHDGITLVEAIFSSNMVTVEYDPEIEPVAEALKPLGDLNAMNVAQLKEQLGQMKEDVSKARAALVK